MMKILIADDEVEMLEMLTKIVNWEKNGFELSGAAKNGMEALEIGRRILPDILITDITMPIMNGLELVEELKKLNPDMGVIILTCHEDFHYAKQAIKLNTDEYLVKYTLTGSELLSSLLSLKQKIDAEKSKKQRIQQLNSEMLNSRIAIETNFLRDILENTGKTIQEILDRGNELGIRLPDKSFRLIGCFVDNFSEVILKSSIPEKGLFTFSILNIIEDLMENEFFTAFHVIDGFYAIVYWDGGKEVLIRQRLIEKLKEIRQSVFSILKVRLSLCVGTTFIDILSLPEALEEVQSLRDGYFYEEAGGIITGQKPFTVWEDNDFFRRLYKDIRTYLTTRDVDRLKTCISSALELFPGKMVLPQIAKKCMWKIATEIDSAAERTGLHSDPELLMADTFGRYVEWLNDKIEMYFAQIGEKGTASTRIEIQRVIEFIEKNLGEEITCDAIADYVNMNPSYFSRVFKNEVGISFSDYLIQKRIERATQLLSSNDLTVEEISHAVGIENINYFYRLYKKVTGRTTKDLKKTMTRQ